MDFLEEEFDEILNIFQVESEEIISRLNNCLLELEKNPGNKDLLYMVFRDAHSLKGASRMIGFVTVQKIAHKLEDILGLAKDDEIRLDTKTVNVLYKTVDLLSDFIQKSIHNKKEIADSKINEQINAIENLTLNKDFSEEHFQEAKSEFNSEVLKNNYEKINKLIVGCLFFLMELEREPNEIYIENLLSISKELLSIFKDMGIFALKKGIEDVVVKLDFVQNGSKVLNESEIEEIQNIMSQIIDSFISTCEMQNLETVDYYAKAFEEASLKKKEDLTKAVGIKTVSVVKDSTADVLDLNFIKEKIVFLKNDFDVESEIQDFLTNFSKNTNNPLINQVIQSVIKILEFSCQNQIPLDDEMISVIKQSIDYCDNTVKNKADISDKELIIQRLGIIQQLLEFNANPKEDYTFLPKNTRTIKPVKIGDFSKIFETGEIKTLRVDSSKLDGLVNQIGELITTKIKTKKHMHELNSINENIREWQSKSIKALNYLKYYEKRYALIDNPDSPLAYISKQLLGIFSENNKTLGQVITDISLLQRTLQEDDTKLNLIIDDLEHMVKNIRVLPMATVFHLFGRMVRDIAQEKKKQIELEIIGSETTADKKIIEEIKTPLIHIIRNAIDHGIETPEERISLGKNPIGKITLSAHLFDNNVIIQIRDDGRGINVEKIREKAVLKGYLKPEEATSMSDEDLTKLIFAPGFSTGEEVTNISGRGIGLDVVQTKISQLNGKVKVISELNKGCIVEIELPTTMSTLKAFLVSSGNQTFALPMTSISTVVWKKSEEIISSKGNKSIIYNGKTIPLYRLGDILKVPKVVSFENQDKQNYRETVLIIENENKIVGITVDRLIGDQEILHKKLSAPLYKLKNISGITTLESGEVCLILNMTEVLKTAVSPKSDYLEHVPTIYIPKKEDYNILLVDDSITTRSLEKNILSKAGYKIELATNPKEAFEKMHLSRFNLIITDVEMPQMNGFEFLEKIKTDEMYHEIPVIMVTSLMNEEDKARARELGAEAYIIKSDFNQQEFLQTIATILEKYSRM